MDTTFDGDFYDIYLYLLINNQRTICKINFNTDIDKRFMRHIFNTLRFSEQGELQLRSAI